MVTKLPRFSRKATPIISENTIYCHHFANFWRSRSCCCTFYTRIAGAALFVGHLSQRFGRRSDLATGFLIGGLGAIGVVISALTNNILLLLFSLLIYGAGTATNLQTRYAGTDLAAPTQRATAISIAMVSTTFGAVAGPNLVNVMGKFTESIGVPTLAGPFILAAAAYIVASLILIALLRPDPLVVAKALAQAQSSTPSHSDHSTGNAASINKKGVIIGATVISRCLDRVGRASGGALSGMILANSSYAILSLGGGFVALLLIPVVLSSRNLNNNNKG